MRKHRFMKKVLLGASLVLAGGTVMGSGCMNTLASINLCGTVFTFCTPVDQLNATWSMLQVPDFDTDPSCTIPLGCGATDLLPGLAGGPGGDDSNEPDLESEPIGGVSGGGGGV